MSHSSLGLTIGIPPDVAETLRQPPSATKEQLPSIADPGGETQQDASSSLLSARLDTTTAELPGIAIQMEKLIGYQPSDEDEIRAIQNQLVQAMWSRYHQTTSDGSVPSSSTSSSSMDQPPPDFDRQVVEFFDTGVARYMAKCQIPKEGHLILEYPSSLQCPITGEHIPTTKILQQIQQKQLPLEFVNKLWTYLIDCSRPLLWKRDMATELSLLLREEQARLEYQEWTESKRQAKLDNLYSVRETLVHQVEMSKTKVEILEEQRDLQVDQAMEPFRRKVLQNTSLETFGSTELSFPDEFQWLGLKDDHVHNDDDDDDDWGQDYDSYEEYSYDSRETDDRASDESSVDEVEDNELDGGFAASVDDVENDLCPRNDVDFRLPKESKPVDSVEEPLMDADQAATFSPTNASTEEKPDTTASVEDTTAKHSLTAAFQRRKKKREKARRRKKEEEKAKEQRAKQQELKRLEEEMRMKFTSQELILAQTMRNALSEKLEKIEELLDSLQDEVWQAEEEAEQESPSENYKSNDKGEQFSLLDQVLAMILGATPMSDEKSPAEHFQFMQREHQSIVQAWKAHFGRLPPPATNSTSNSDKEISERPLSSKEQRQLLGITDNDCDDWDAVENWDSILDETNKNNKVTTSGSAPSVPSQSTIATPGLQNKTHIKVETAPPKLVGLRPGGRAIRPKSSEQ